MAEWKRWKWRTRKSPSGEADSRDLHAPDVHRFCLPRLSSSVVTKIKVLTRSYMTGSLALACRKYLVAGMILAVLVSLALYTLWGRVEAQVIHACEVSQL